MKQKVNNKTLVLYVPGYGSNGNSSTFAKLKKYEDIFDVDCLTYDNNDPTIAEKQLDMQIRYHLNVNKDILLIASSLGGYWGNYFAQKYNFPVVLINPSLNPETSLVKYGIAETFLNKYKKSTFKKGSRLVFLGHNDTVVDPHNTEKELKGKADIVWLQEGHQISNFESIINKIKKFINYV